MSGRLHTEHGPVVIHRDRWGMPSIEASSEAAAWFGVGYAQAEDHLEELLAHWLLARGELSRLFGAAGLEVDRQQRRWDVLAHARNDLAALPEHLQTRHASFVAGVAHHLERHPSQAPRWTPELEPALPMARLRTLVWPWAVADAMQALESTGIDGLTVDAGAAIGFERGSNAWALAGHRTSDGGAMLLADPHLPLGGLLEEDGSPRLAALTTGAQFLPFEFALACDELTFVGHCPVGLATPGLATTPRVAWALTTGQPNCSDAYRIVTTGDGLDYLVDDELRRIERRTEFVEMADGDPVAVEVESVRVNGRFAPVVARVDDVAHVVSTPYVDDLWRTEVQLDAMLRAADLDELLESFDHEGMFPQNVVAADAGGRIGYVRAGRVPIRPPSVDVGTVLDGNTRATEWLGIHPPKDLLRVVDPAGGFLQCCNTAPDTVTGGQGELWDDASPDYLFNDEPGRCNSRGERIVDLFADASRRTSLEDALDAATDDVWVDTPLWQRALSAASDVVADADDELQRMHAELCRFDGRARADSTAAVWWQYWREALHRDEPQDAQLCQRVEDAELDHDVARWVLRALARGRDRLLQDVGRLDVQYGDVFRVGPPSQSAPGAGGTFLRRPPGPTDRKLPVMSPLRVTGYDQLAEDGRRRAAFGGPALRLSHLSPNATTTHTALLEGQASRPGHPHRADQAPLLAERRLRTVPLEPDAWRSGAVSTTSLDPTTTLDHGA